MGFFKTLATGYGIIFKNLGWKFGNIAPKVFVGSGTGLMMIGNALIARENCKAEVRKTLADIENDWQEAKKPVEGESKVERGKRIFKARVVKGWRIVKVHKKGMICSGVGAVSNVVGITISETGRQKALAATAALGAEFAGYRAAVRADLGDEADLKYLTGRKAVNGKKSDAKYETGEYIEEYEDEDGVTIKKDPSAFRFLFSKESCPSLWQDNYDLRLANLKWVESNLSRVYLLNHHITLNDMRREFGGLTPNRMDVGIGGIFGRVWIEDKPETHKLINLHYEDDEEFMSGRKDWCWIIFECDPDPIISKINRKFTQVNM